MCLQGATSATNVQILTLNKLAQGAKGRSEVLGPLLPPLWSVHRF